MTLYDHDTERQYLGAIIGDVGVLDRHPLPPESLHAAPHAAILGAMLDLHARRAPVELLGVIGALERSGALRRIGTHEDFYACVRAPEAPIEAIRARLHDLAELREARDLLLRAVVACDAMDIEGALDHANRVVDGARLARAREPRTAGELVRSVLTDLQDKTRRPLVPVGVTGLDHIIGGLVVGDLLTIGAQTNVGKSWATLTLAANAARAGHRAGIISLEDPPSLWATRLMAMLSDVSSARIRCRQLDEAAMNAMENGCVDAMGLPLDVVPAIGASIYEIIDTMRMLVLDRGCEVVTVDYAQCLHGVDANSDHAALKRMVGMLKSAAERLGVPLILTSQIKRGDDPDREPAMYDLKEGGDLEIKSEYVVMLWRGKPVPGGPLSARIHAKLAKSKVGGVGLRWDWLQQESGALREADALPTEPPASRLYDLETRRRR